VSDADFPPAPTRGRVVRVDRHVGLGDVRADGRLRLDALARFLQDAADHDAHTAPASGAGVWVLRRLAVRLHHTPRFRADVSLHTWCSGVGPRWAERRTDVEHEGALGAEAVALWAHVDPARGLPLPLPDGFDECWGGAAHLRRVRARLRHDPPHGARRTGRWALRAVDIDVLGHVNNAVYWAPVEDELARRGDPRVTWAEMEFRAGLERGDRVDVHAADREGGFAVWMTVGGVVRASALVGCRRGPGGAEDAWESS
jgi:acyl-ACP thioesterase